MKKNWNDEDILTAMSVMPIAWLTAGEIFESLSVVRKWRFSIRIFRGDGRTITPVLKQLLAKGLIVRNGNKWRLSAKQIRRRWDIGVREATAC